MARPVSQHTRKRRRRKALPTSISFHSLDMVLTISTYNLLNFCDDLVSLPDGDSRLAGARVTTVCTIFSGFLTSVHTVECFAS